MLIEDSFIQSALYLYADVHEGGTIERKPIGTAFGVTILHDEDKTMFYYFVTANHVLQRAEQYNTVFIRFNKKDGTTEDVATDPVKDWIPHHGLNADVAINWRTEIPAGWKHKLIPFDFLADDEFLTERGVAPGDELFSVGLFTPQPGSPQMVPLCRFGNISTMPQLVTSKLLGPGSEGVLVEGYLTEWRSFGGASGSPVFIHFQPDREPNKITFGTPTVRLLGLIHGHIEIRQEIEYTGDSWSKGSVDINSGVAVVIPAKTIKEVLMTDRLVEDRREELVRVRRIQAAASSDAQES